MEDLKRMPLAEYIKASITWGDGTPEGLEKVEKLKESFGKELATYQEVAETFRMMTASILADVDISNKVQASFNVTVLDALTRSRIITPTDKENILKLLDSALEQAYQELEENIDTQEANNEQSNPN